MDTVILIGRIVFVLLFLGSGVGHLAQADVTAATAARRGVPNPKIMAQLTGVTFLLGGLAVLLGVWMDLALLGLALQVLIIGFVMHPFWKESGEVQTVEMSMFMKNLCIVGACLMLFGFVAGLDYDAVSITGPVFDLPNMGFAPS